MSDNVRVEQFNKFLSDNEIKAFEVEELDDELKTTIFRSRVEAKGQNMPLAILIDNSIFTMIRTQVATGISEEKKERVSEHLNKLNHDYKIFKYYLREDGSIYLDICLPFVDDKFDPQMIQLMLSVLVEHLQVVYEDFMAAIWSK